MQDGLIARFFSGNYFHGPVPFTRSVAALPPSRRSVEQSSAVTLTAAGNVQFAAHQGRNDDLVLATGLAWIGVGITGGIGFVQSPITWTR